jgi:NADH-quinone oxidoreductase subunit L
VINLAWLIPLLPGAAFAVIGLFTRRQKGLSAALSILAVALAAALSYAIFFEVMAGATLDRTLPWVTLGGQVELPFGWQVDALTAIMLIVVTTISLLVQVFSWGYMEAEDETEYLTADYETAVPGDLTHGHDEHGNLSSGQSVAHSGHAAGTAVGHGHHGPREKDPSIGRFYAYLSLFTAAMLGLVLANNLATIYIFWEGVGLGSFLLIGFWFQRTPRPSDRYPLVNKIDERPSPFGAAMKAFVTTRLGDFGMLLGILILWATFGTLEFTALAEKIEHDPLAAGAVTAAAILLFCGAVGKSAQFPLHVWLPDAMEGPTPVSALIHAATMVAAGVYLVARALPIFEGSPNAMLVVAIIGGFTAIFAATMGLVADDLKRVMAYSTVSQLGYMMLGLGAGALAAGTFHLFTHAFFKALLFLAAGSVIHMAHSQKLSELGGLKRYMPVTCWTMFIAALSLAGIPPLSGFWSKDAVLAATAERAGGPNGTIYYVLLLFALITVFMTAFYMFRAWFLTFFGAHRGVHADQLHAEPAFGFMTAPLILLAIPSIVVGLWGSPFGGDGFQSFVEGHPVHEDVNVVLAGLGTLLGVAGIGVAFLMYGSRVISAAAVTRAFGPLYRLPINKYYLDDLYQGLIDRILLAFSRFLAFVFDARVVDGIVNGIGRLAIIVGGMVRVIQTGRVQSYAMYVFGGLALISLLTIIFGTGR